jgi:DNA repair protein RadA/Sms
MLVCKVGGSSSPDGISQVRKCMALLLRLAKLMHISIWVIGHVTKTGNIVGPRMVQHMVNAVLDHLEQAGASSYQWLRAHKHSFGSCQTVGLYKFTNNGILRNGGWECQFNT